MPKELVYQDVENFSLKKASLDKSMLAMDIRLYNPNGYPLRIKSADIDVFMNGNRLGKLNTSNDCSLPAHDTGAVPVTLEVALKDVLPSMLQLLMNSEADIKLTGRLRAGRKRMTISIPVNYEGRHDILSGIR
jgi:LEA14-like dessication related protein